MQIPTPTELKRHRLSSTAALQLADRDDSTPFATIQLRSRRFNSVGDDSALLATLQVANRDDSALLATIWLAVGDALVHDTSSPVRASDPSPPLCTVMVTATVRFFGLSL